LIETGMGFQEKVQEYLERSETHATLVDDNLIY
jgi:hypothetical protein